MHIRPACLTKCSDVQGLKPRILTISYASQAFIKAVGHDVSLQEMAEVLLADFSRVQPTIGAHGPVMFVGHSLGGLLMKQLCVTAHQQVLIDCPSWLP